MSAAMTTSARRARKPRAIDGRLAGLLGLVVPVLFLLVLVPVLPLTDPNAQDLLGSLSGPSSEHWLGTDDLGRDVLSRVLYGARTTIAAALLAVAIAAAIGVPLGLIAGYRRGMFDAVASRAADAIMSVPPLILLLAAIAALGQGVTKSMVILGIIVSPRLFRVVRGTTIGLGGSEFIEVGRMSGCGTARILGRYVLPNIRNQVIVQLTILLGYGVLTEASISFLGLGVKAPDPSLGVLLKSAVEYISQAPYLTIAPGLMITGFILACNLVGDSYSSRKDDV